MTESPMGRRCGWCRRVLPVAPGPGRPRLFCKQGCRQRHYEARQRARELGVGETELVVARAALDELSDRLYVLECAVDDVVRDLAGARTVAEHREALDWLLEAARQVLDQHPVTRPRNFT